MGIGKEMAGWLRSRATLVAMLDADAAKAPRIHPRRLPQSAGPNPKAIVYHTISDVSEQSMQGVVKMSNAVMQFDCYGRTPDEADTLRDMLKKQLDALFRGSVGTLFVSGLEHEGDRDAEDDASDGSDQARFISQCDYRIAYQRPTS